MEYEQYTTSDFSIVILCKVVENALHSVHLAIKAINLTNAGLLLIEPSEPTFQ